MEKDIKNDLSSGDRVVMLNGETGTVKEVVSGAEKASCAVVVDDKIPPEELKVRPEEVKKLPLEPEKSNPNDPATFAQRQLIRLAINKKYLPSMNYKHWMELKSKDADKLINTLSPEERAEVLREQSKSNGLDKAGKAIEIAGNGFERTSRPLAGVIDQGVER